MGELIRCESIARPLPRRTRICCRARRRSRSDGGQRRPGGSGGGWAEKWSRHHPAAFRGGSIRFERRFLLALVTLLRPPRFDR